MSLLAAPRAQPRGMWLPKPTVFDFMGGSLPGGTALTRASSGWYFNSTPTLVSAGANAARFTYDPVSGALAGLLVEPAATDSHRNSSANGGASGSPGTQPTNWSLTGNSGVFNGLTRTLGNPTTEDGIPCIDVTYAGTPSATASITMSFEGNTQIAAANGQTWLGSMWLRVMAGALRGNPVQNVIERDSGGTSLGTTAVVRSTISGAALRTQRFDLSRTFNNASTAFASHNLTYQYNNGQAENFTLRIGLPMLVQASAATSPVPTTTAAVTRAADALALTLANGTYQIALVRASGLTLLKATVSGGAYTVPTDPSPLQRVAAWRLK